MSCEGYEYSLKLNPYHIYVLNDLGTCRGKEGKTGEAFELYRKSLVAAPNFRETLYKITTLHYKQEQHDSAIFYFQKINDPANQEKYNVFLNAVVKSQFEKYIQAVDEYEVKRKIRTIQNTDEWVTALLEQAEQTGKPFEKRVIHNAIFNLKENNVHSKEKFEHLLSKYEL